MKLSILVIAYRMKRQAQNTLYSLCTDYQRRVDRADYEVVVVENASDEMLDPAAVAALPGQFFYHRRDEAGVSPAAAINFGLARCRGELIGLIIDGAHMLSPGVLRNVLDTGAIADEPVVAVPGYHLGDQPHGNLPAQHADQQQAMLAAMRWREDGYRLFSHACFSPANKQGYLHPLMECNALFCTAQNLRRIGGADESFDLPGGGSLNLHLYRQLALAPASTLFILPGEGSFHQFHGGVTTAAAAEREHLLQRFQDQLNARWGGRFTAVARAPILLGKVGAGAQPHLALCCANAQRRFLRLRAEGKPAFADEPPAAAPGARPARPLLSIVVIVHNMPRQALNTLYSLSAAYQRGVSAAQYEVIVVENASAATLAPAAVAALGDNFHYHLRDETAPTPVHAVNFGVAAARADHVCLIIDGARMVTPGVVRCALDILRLTPRALVAIPGYHLGGQDQKQHLAAGHDETVEQRLLEEIGWRDNGYALFDIACVSGANTHGVFHPLLESNCLTFARAAFERIGGAHPGFRSPGGGSVNLDIYRSLAMLPDSRLFIAPGEGSFHQFHGGVTTAQAADLEQTLAAHREEYRGIRGEFYTAVQKEPTLYGAVAAPALRFLEASSHAAQKRLRRFAANHADPWAHDAPARARG